MLFELTLFTQYAGQSCVNRWNYISTGTPAVASLSYALLYAFGAIPDPAINTQFRTGSVMEYIQELVSNGVTFVASSAKAIYDVEDFYEIPYVPARTGDNSGSQGSSPVLAFGFRTNRVRQDIRRATKRFVGVYEGAIGTGGVIESGAAGVMATLADRMSAILTYDDEGNTLSFAPCVVAKQQYTPAGSDVPAYRYYPSLVTQMEHVGTGVLWQPYAQVRSQTSRQYGRGQ